MELARYPLLVCLRLACGDEPGAHPPEPFARGEPLWTPQDNTASVPAGGNTPLVSSPQRHVSETDLRVRELKPLGATARSHESRA